jgi:hypothetical protein
MIPPIQESGSIIPNSDTGKFNKITSNRAYETIETNEYKKTIENKHTGNKNFCYA